MAQLAPPYFSTFTDDAYNRRIDYPLHEVIADMHKQTLKELFLPIRLERIQDVSLRLPSGSETFALADLFDGVATAVWAPVSKGPTIYQRSLQRMHVQKMIQIMIKPDSRTPADAQALARLILNEIEGQLQGAPKSPSRINQAHNNEILALIKTAKNASATHSLK